MAIADRGFASMSSARQRKIASQGGKVAHAKGVAHEWTRPEARDAGREGGIATHRNRRARLTGAETTATAAEEITKPRSP
jgi:general stress protein YciG